MDGWMGRWMGEATSGARPHLPRHRCRPRVIGTPMRCSQARHLRQPMHKVERQPPKKPSRTTCARALETEKSVKDALRRKKRSYSHGACVCMWTWWQSAPLRLEHVWNGSGTGSGTVTRVACTSGC